jgi:hypothetical protein
MLSNDKLERDITRLGDGKFVGLIIGGEKYIDCPRLTEFVVSMTRHLPPLLNKIDTTLSQLDATASMGSITIRMYDRKTKLGTESFLASKDSDDNAVDRPFGVICSMKTGQMIHVTLLRCWGFINLWRRGNNGIWQSRESCLGSASFVTK